MKPDSTLRLFGRYLLDRRGILLLFGGFAALFAVVFLFYNLPVEAVAYAALLCAAVGAAVIAADFPRYLRRHREMAALLGQITAYTGSLPPAHTLPEADMRDLAAALLAERANLIGRMEEAQRDQLDYIALWAHQIKTPIAAIRLLLPDGEESDAPAAELFKIEQYVETVLSYLRLNSDSTDFVLRRVPLDDIVRRAVRKYARLFVQQKLRLDFAPLGCEVLTDEKWLVFVVEQLLSNALKYTREGGISIYMQPGERCTLVIEDTGIGIQAEDLPRVFEKGFTGYNGRTGRKSTGIGLYLCRRILHKLSHGISIESAVGRGTIVRLRLDTNELAVE